MISIIIVNYHVKKELFICLQSIYNSKPKSPFEVIIVDNDEEKTLKKELKKKFPKAIYVQNNNKGYGQGNNVGTKHAKGEYLFFLNPDTEFLNNTIDSLTKFLKGHTKAAIVAPLLFDKHHKPYSLQGVKELTPFRGIFVFSFLNKLFSNNKIFREYYLLNWDKTKTKEVDVVPGTAFVIRKEVFDALNGFDEKFFLFFEEFDICKRVKALGWEIYILPSAKIFHAWGNSTKQRSDIDKIFEKSRYYYFKKHFGILSAVFTRMILQINKYSMLLLLILCIGFCLRIANIDQTMPFIGDQGWFYLSARDMLLTGNIPLVGIASSHPWLHQGAFWTYLLAFWFWLFGFNPVNGAYLSAILDVLAIIFLYKLGTEAFSKNVGLIAAVLYATSPLIIANARMPYHTSPIPLFTIIALYFFYKWTSGKSNYFPFVIALLAILYNFELATFLLTAVFILVLLYGIVKKLEWARAVFHPKIIVLSIIGFILPMLPMLFYDVRHGFLQTIGFLVWIGYRMLVVVGFPPLHLTTQISFGSLMNFSIENYKQFVYPFNGVFAFIIFAASSFYMGMKLINRGKNIIMLIVLNILLVIGFFVAKTPSSAYLPVMFPGFLFVIALFFNWTFRKEYLKDITLPFFVFVVLFNCFYIFFQIYAHNQFFTQRLAIAQYIVNEANGKEYNIKGKGIGSQFESFTMNYEYLTWWLGNEPTKERRPVQFLVEEKDQGIIVNKSQ